MRDTQEREFSHTLIQALTPAVRLALIPKSAVDIYVNVLENDGTNACLAAAIIASSVVLADEVGSSHCMLGCKSPPPTITTSILTRFCL
ncbi:unnamed protein product [Absidia cylindrospora]